MRITPRSLEIADHVVGTIKGRAADGGVSLPFLVSMVQLAPDGNHVDIGSLFGASAIAVALMKKELGHTGKVYCIDPYDEKERSKSITIIDDDVPPEQLNGSPEILLENAEKFGVELELIQKPSYPWPDELKDVTFATAYIDGNHHGDNPWNDFESLRGRTVWYIGADNFEEAYPNVVEAVLKASNTEDWFLYYKNMMFVALRRILPFRADPVNPHMTIAN